MLLLRIYSAEFVKILETVYQIPMGRKSEAIKMPLWLEYDDLLEYLNGYFDGDGSITANRSGVKSGRWGPYVSPRIVFSSKSRPFIESLSSFLQKSNFDVNGTSYDGNVYRVKMYGRKNLQRFVETFKPRHPQKVKVIKSLLQGECVP